MLTSLREIISDNIRCAELSLRFGYMDLEQERRGTVLGWFWIFFKPALFIACFAVALGIGLKQFGAAGNEYPYVLFLSAGLIPWLYMSDMLHGGTEAFTKGIRYLRISNLPLTVLPSIFSVSSLIVFLICFAAVLVASILYGLWPVIYWLQVPLLIILMAVFFYFFSLLMSCFSALSKDFKNFIHNLSTPLFWTSGVLFDVASVDNLPFQVFLAINPISFFVRGFRAATCDYYWIFALPEVIVPFTAVFLLTAILAGYYYNILNSEVRDAISTP